MWLAPAGSRQSQHMSPSDSTIDADDAARLLDHVDQIAADEIKGMAFNFPIFGLKGDIRPEPGPLVWEQTSDSYMQSISGDGWRKLKNFTDRPSCAACPGKDVVFIKCGGKHLGGSAPGASGSSTQMAAHVADAASPSKPSDICLRFVCSQSKLAAELKKGKTKVDAEQGSSGLKKVNRGVLPVAERQARFSVALRNSKSRQKKCSICNECITYSFDADPEPEHDKWPTTRNEAGECPWASRGHVMKAGIRVIHVSTQHSGHFCRKPRLGRRVASAVAESMSPTKRGSNVSNGSLASLLQGETGGMLPSKEVNSVMRQVAGGNAVGTGVPGLLQQLEKQEDVAYIIKWRVVNRGFVKTGYSVDEACAPLSEIYELYLPAAGSSGATRWGVTDLLRLTEAGSNVDWCVASYFRDGNAPGAAQGVRIWPPPTLPDGAALNAAATHWQTSKQSAEALRCMQHISADTTPKTNSTCMEYGVLMVKTACWETMHLGHYCLNGLSKANYGAMLAFCRMFVGRAAAERVELIITDGDAQLADAAETATLPTGLFGEGAPAAHALCRFHTINIPLMKTMAKHGFTGDERDLAADIKDCIHHIFRSCETTAELNEKHLQLIQHIQVGPVPEGPARRRGQMQKAGSAHARMMSKPKLTRKRHEIEKFARLSPAQSEGSGPPLVVKWVEYNDETTELSPNLFADLGAEVFNQFCRAAGINPKVALQGKPSQRETAEQECKGPRAHVDELDANVDDLDGVAQKFGEDLVGNMIEARWVGHDTPTTEPAGNMLADLGFNMFKALRNAAGLSLTSMNIDLPSERLIDVTASTILLVWYEREIWPKRRKLAWCYRRGAMHMGLGTTGGAENTFRVTKLGDSVTTKTSLQNLGQALQFQERRRFANINAPRSTEFSIQLPGVVGAPQRHLKSWPREGLNRASREASLAGLGSAPSYWIWEAPAKHANADACWVVPKRGARSSGDPHRARVVHCINGVMICTCWVWEMERVECRHCLAINGSVSEASAGIFWRRATVQGANDIHVLRSQQCQRGPPIRRPVSLHAAEGRPSSPPNWNVKFHDSHAEFVGSDQAPIAALSMARGTQKGSNAAKRAAPEDNYDIAKGMKKDMDEIMSIASRQSSTEEMAMKIAEGIKGVLGDARKLRNAVVGGGRRASHHGVVVATEMRSAKPGPGASKRRKGAYEKL